MQRKEQEEMAKRTAEKQLAREREIEERQRQEREASSQRPSLFAGRAAYGSSAAPAPAVSSSYVFSLSNVMFFLVYFCLGLHFSRGQMMTKCIS